MIHGTRLHWKLVKSTRPCVQPISPTVGILVRKRRLADVFVGSRTRKKWDLSLKLSLVFLLPTIPRARCAIISFWKKELHWFRGEKSLCFFFFNLSLLHWKENLSLNDFSSLKFCEWEEWSFSVEKTRFHLPIDYSVDSFIHSWETR